MLPTPSEAAAGSTSAAADTGHSHTAAAVVDRVVRSRMVVAAVEEASRSIPPVIAGRNRLGRHLRE